MFQLKFLFCTSLVETEGFSQWLWVHVSYIYDFDQTEKKKFMNMLIVVGPSWRRNLLKIEVLSVHSAVVRNAIFIVGVSSAVHNGVQSMSNSYESYGLDARWCLLLLRFVYLHCSLFLSYLFFAGVEVFNLNHQLPSSAHLCTTCKGINGKGLLLSKWKGVFFIHPIITLFLILDSKPLSSHDQVSSLIITSYVLSCLNMSVENRYLDCEKKELIVSAHPCDDGQPDFQDFESQNTAHTDEKH